MSESKHTPGPWYAIGGEVFKDLGDVAGLVCTCENWSEDTEHNGLLIAAAPELLEALQIMSAYYSGSLDHQPAFVKLGRAAIAKATAT